MRTAGTPQISSRARAPLKPSVPFKASTVPRTLSRLSARARPTRGINAPLAVLAAFTASPSRPAEASPDRLRKATKTVVMTLSSPIATSRHRPASRLTLKEGASCEQSLSSAPHQIRGNTAFFSSSISRFRQKSSAGASVAAVLTPPRAASRGMSRGSSRNSSCDTSSTARCAACMQEEKEVRARASRSRLTTQAERAATRPSDRLSRSRVSSRDSKARASRRASSPALFFSSPSSREEKSPVRRGMTPASASPA